MEWRGASQPVDGALAIISHMMAQYDKSEHQLGTWRLSFTGFNLHDQ